ncbi:MAG: DUF1772 domain-containing protein [Gammaproteobacteria bacterium]|nr:DUF1772 domain-containing protein [Gammaproteobacteria bacterium]MDH5729781.1 DUF1772 domain-containing protein [Gammaproteobacteria bacterium]
MKNILLAINHGYYFWGTSVYVGLLWSLHFIFYPSWQSINADSIAEHFLVPVNAATSFFTFVVPFMLLAGLVMIYFEWKTSQRWTALLAYGSLLLMMVVGGFLIRPVNEWIAAALEKGNVDSLLLQEQLKDWMLYNDMRLLIMTTMWIILLVYFYKKNNLIKTLS